MSLVKARRTPIHKVLLERDSTTVHHQNGLRRLWKSLPTPVRRWSHKSLAILRRSSTYFLVRLFRRGTKAPALPINVAGFFSTPSGVGQAARLFADALESYGVDVRRLDVGPTLGHSGPLPFASAPYAERGLLISFLNPPELEAWLSKGGLRLALGGRHLGYWAWELPVAPKSWARATRLVDGVVCQTEFTAASLRALAPDFSVSVATHPMFMLPAVSGDRSSLKIANGACVVLAYADLKSTAARKNPLGALQAYLKAVPVPNPQNCVLIYKIRNIDWEQKFPEMIRTIVRDRGDIIFLWDDLSQLEMLKLVATCDIAISLHRAEGFGMLAAEAMWYGRALVVTGWSGVTEFVDNTCAKLVDYTLVPVDGGEGIYVSGVWAEPCLEDAAAKLAALIDDGLARETLGSLARARAREAFDRDRWIVGLEEILGVGLTDRMASDETVISAI